MDQNKMTWTMLEINRILDLWEDDYIIYNVTDWEEHEISYIRSKLMSWGEYDNNTNTLSQNGKTLIIRYPESGLSNMIHVFTKDFGSDSKIPIGETIHDFIKFYVEL